MTAHCIGPGDVDHQQFGVHPPRADNDTRALGVRRCPAAGHRSDEEDTAKMQRRGMHEVADGVWAWVAASGTWGYSNAGLIAGRDASAMVDTLYDLHLTRELLDAIDPLLAGRPLTDLVNTHGNGDHCFGNQLLPARVRVHAAPDAASTLEAESPSQLAALLRQDLGPVLGPFLHRCFGEFDLDGIVLRTADILI